MAHSTFVYLTSNPTSKQCAIPVFKDLLPPKHDKLVQTLLFHLAEWQALAKLRLHIEDTLTAAPSSMMAWCTNTQGSASYLSCLLYEGTTTRISSTTQEGDGRCEIWTMTAAANLRSPTLDIQYQHLQISCSGRL